MQYVLGPYQFDEAEQAWSGPLGFRYAVDLSPAAAPTDQRVGIFACDGPVGDSAYFQLGTGDLREIQTTTLMRSAFLRELRYRPEGDTLADLVWDCLTSGADPSGEAACKPLMPTRKRELNLWLGPKVRSEPFSLASHGHANRVRALMQRDFRATWERDQTLARKTLDFACHKYGVDDWQQFVPSDLRQHVPGRLKRETTITESFNTANSTTLGPDLTWTEVANNWLINSNAAVVGATGQAAARAEHDLSGDDHYAEIVISGLDEARLAPSARFAAAANTHYFCELFESGTGFFMRLRRSEAGFQTNIVGQVNPSLSLPCTIRTEVDGSDLDGLLNGVSQTTGTDTNITGNTRCGMWLLKNAVGSTVAADSFAASDLGGGGGATATVGKLLLMGVGG